MELVICKDRQELAQAVNEWIEALLGESPNRRSLYVPAGSTPEPLYKLWRDDRPSYLRRLDFLQIDDVLEGPKKGCFQNFLSRELEPWCSQIVNFDRGDRQAEMALLGLGLNGHVAFHEPGLTETFYSGCLTLSRESCERLKLKEGTWAGSYGLGAFMACQQVGLMVWGEAKREILRQFLESQGNFPALVLRRHPQLKVFVDHSAHPLKQKKRLD